MRPYEVVVIFEAGLEGDDIVPQILHGNGVGGKCADRHRPEALQPRQNRELRRAQPGLGQKLVIELRYMPGSLAQRQTIAKFGLQPRVGVH